MMPQLFQSSRAAGADGAGADCAGREGSAAAGTAVTVPATTAAAAHSTAARGFMDCSRDDDEAADGRTAQVTALAASSREQHRPEPVPALRDPFGPRDALERPCEPL
ncbi:hypothetical protein Saso_60140 [Streptomyces asoensis]|uniref:Uncharacterized protein n=1 Tax=Streptomyces asoensis TaxID=249586 RepID=A0ABQ3S8E4_9ACTN|nr:hypothetical protein GCM10010496_54730 [Streptomyces asoensis]GHI64364.1 hypothetical protein Saso_60140 [Streptomyces asoensis]